jgi:ATPase family associated with various cellular activities (AAA)
VNTAPPGPDPALEPASDAPGPAPAWARWVRLAGRARVEEVRAAWRSRDTEAGGRRGSARGVHVEVDEILRDSAFAARQGPDAAVVEAAGRAAAAEPRFARLLAACGLGTREAEWLALLAMCQADPRWGRVLGYLDDDLRSLAPTLSAAAAVWGWAPGTAGTLGPGSAPARWHLAGPSDTGITAWSPDTPWSADPDVVAYLCGQEQWWSFHRGLTLIPSPAADAGAPRECLYPGTLREIVATVTALAGARPARPCEVEVAGRAGSGRRTLLCQAAAALGRPALVIDDPALGVRAVRTARLLGAIPVWAAAPQDPRVPEYPRISPDPLPGVITMIAREAPDTSPHPSTPAGRISWRLPDIGRPARLRLWSALAPGHPVPTAVREWTLTPAEIAAAAVLAPAGPDAVTTAARRALGTVSSTLLSPLPCPYDWDDLVLSDGVLARLRELDSRVRLRTDVLDGWEFGRLTPGRRGVTALFAGPSGTGKTMAAQVLARSLGLGLYRADLAEVVDKYIGETEKRLARIFDECERRRVLLLFDEADALFGQRTRVRDAHDRFANIEIDYLLQRMETFDGTAVLATNRKGDLDQGFLRRLDVVVDFLSPAPTERLRLWRLALPERTAAGEPVTDRVDLDRLAEDIALTGAEIKAVALSAAYLACAGGELIGMHHVWAAARTELAKRGSVLRTNGVHRPDGAATATSPEVN